MTEPYYAVTRKLDPATGQWVLDADGRTYARGQPAAELVLRVLRTPRGSSPLDPTYGLDTSRLDRARADLAVTAQGAIVAALDFLVRARRITDLRVAVSVERDRLLFTVDFYDPRARERVPVADTLTLGA